MRQQWPARRKHIRKVVKERMPIAPPSKVIPDRRKEEEKKEMQGEGDTRKTG